MHAANATVPVGAVGQSLLELLLLTNSASAEVLRKLVSSGSTGSVYCAKHLGPPACGAFHGRGHSSKHCTQHAAIVVQAGSDMTGLEEEGEEVLRKPQRSITGVQQDVLPCRSTSPDSCRFHEMSRPVGPRAEDADGSGPQFCVPQRLQLPITFEILTCFYLLHLPACGC